MDKYRVRLASPPDRAKLVAEVFFDDMQWAEISQEHNTLEVEFYPRPDGHPWKLDLAVAVDALGNAERKLRE